MAPTSSGEVLPARSGVDETMRVPLCRSVGLACAALILAGWAVYLNSFGGTFIFDDGDSILRNPTIRQGWWEALHPPAGGLTVSGRPLVNLSLALNYRLDGFDGWSYHAVNLAIQLLAGLTVFGLVRRTLISPRLRDRHGAAALPLAFVAALLWMVHPLQTESVTYLVQRAEAMMALFYLLTLYCFVRSLESTRAWVWLMLSVAACFLGMFCKEVMVFAPLIVLLYDRTFVAETFTRAWRQRWKFYAALAGAWLPLVWLVRTEGNRGKSVGFAGDAGVAAYAQSQFVNIIKYLYLSFWPHPLVLDYGPQLEHNPWIILPCALAVAALLAGTFYALWRRPPLGFLGAWFFAILAPSSSIVPVVTQSMAEHRMYLPLAALAVLVSLGLQTLLGQRAFVAGLILALALGGLTFERNRDYRTEISVWADSVQKRPGNSHASRSLGSTLQDGGRFQEALAPDLTAVRLDPNDAEAENNLGADLNALGQPAEALIHLRKSIALDSSPPEPYFNLGNSCVMLKQPDAARDAYLAALRINPHYAAAHSSLGSVYLVNPGQIDQAIAEFKTALQDDPMLASAQSGLGDASMRSGHPAEAIPHYDEAIRLEPDFGEAHRALGDALLINGRITEAIPQYESAERLLPGNAAVCNALGAALGQLGRLDEATRQFEAALRIDPNYTRASDNLKKIHQLAAPPSIGPAP